MHYTKKLVFFILLIGILLPSQKSFRGLKKDQILHSSVPISFTHHIASNYDILPQQLSAVRGSYLIISREGLVNQGYVDVFADFKKTQGFDVSVVALSDSELDVNIVQDYITQYYNDDPMLEYVLLIGDVDGFAEIPSYYYGPENDVTDQKYTHLSGDDFIPDVFIGRISVDSAYELAVIMLKTIAYVREPLAYNQDWLDRALVVAGNYANTPPIPITPKWTSYWLRDELIDYGYSSVDTVFYPPIQQGAPYITEIIDNGVGIVNYRGWGDANGWHYPEFHADDVTGLNNGWLTPVFMSYVCNSNDFANNVDPCFSEAMLRGGTTTNPKGGVAFIGPSDLHTSTKYNNVINASMYDAMINHGIVELGRVSGKLVRPTITKALDRAKMNIIEIRRGSGSWECSTAVPNSLPFEVSGRTGSTRITIKPAPPGVGLVTNQVGKIMLKLAGVEDAWSFTKGQTQTIYNFANAMFNALQKTTTTKLLPGQDDFHNMVKGVKQE